MRSLQASFYFELRNPDELVVIFNYLTIKSLKYLLSSFI